MLGLMYIGGALLYLILMFIVVRWAWRLGHANDGSSERGVIFALLGALAMCIPLLFSVLPTVLAHQESCALDAGYQELVSPTQWLAKHPNLAQRLKNMDLTKRTRVARAIDDFTRDIDFSGNRAWDYRVAKATKWGVEVTRIEQRIVDVVDGSILAKGIDYSTGSQDDALFWRTRMSCFPQSESPTVKLIYFSYEMMGVIK